MLDASASAFDMAPGSDCRCFGVLGFYSAGTPVRILKTARACHTLNGAHVCFLRTGVWRA